jgi:hypothetical protein
VAGFQFSAATIGRQTCKKNIRLKLSLWFFTPGSGQNNYYLEKENI